MKQLFHAIALRIYTRLLNVSRAEIVTTGFLLFALMLLTVTFKYTVLENTYYADLASKQQSQVVKNPVSRGTIYSNNDPI